jgi:hypothetical protein
MPRSSGVCRVAFVALISGALLLPALGCGSPTGATKGTGGSGPTTNKDGGAPKPKPPNPDPG